MPKVREPAGPRVLHADAFLALDSGRSDLVHNVVSEAETSPIERSRRAESIPAISRSDSTNAKSSEATGPPQAPKFSQKIN